MMFWSLFLSRSLRVQMMLVFLQFSSFSHNFLPLKYEYFFHDPVPRQSLCSSLVAKIQDPSKR
jgi:hypothetical protein